MAANWGEVISSQATLRDSRRYPEEQNILNVLCLEGRRLPQGMTCGDDLPCLHSLPTPAFYRGLAQQLFPGMDSRFRGSDGGVVSGMPAFYRAVWIITRCSPVWLGGRGWPQYCGLLPLWPPDP